MAQKEFKIVEGLITDDVRGVVFVARDGETQVPCRAPVETLLALDRSVGNNRSRFESGEARQVFLAHRLRIEEAARRIYFGTILRDKPRDTDGFIAVHAIDLWPE